MKKFVAVAGNIGVGKSTLVTLLCERLGWQPFYEPVAENPYLADFYHDMRTWSFHSQIFFLSHRLRTHRQLLDHALGADTASPHRGQVRSVATMPACSPGPSPSLC